jgi:hypothetical protein
MKCLTITQYFSNNFANCFSILSGKQNDANNEFIQELKKMNDYVEEKFNNIFIISLIFSIFQTQIENFIMKLPESN